MIITHMTYALVRKGGTVPKPSLKPVDPVLDFVTEHVNKLLKLADRKGSAPPGRFFDEERQNQFHCLHSGTADEFLDAFHGLAVGLIKEMSSLGNPKEGILVGFRARLDHEDIVAGVLKMELNAMGAAVHRDEDAAQIDLETIVDLIDGALQKGAMVRSGSASEEVHCRDTGKTPALYFPKALGIKVHPNPRRAMVNFLETVNNVDPMLASPIAKSISACAKGSVRHVLAELSAKVPGLTGVLQAEILEQLGALPQPVWQIDPTQAVNIRYEIGQITVSGPAAEIEEFVEIGLMSNGRWRLVIESDAEPKPVHNGQLTLRG